MVPVRRTEAGCLMSVCALPIVPRPPTLKRPNLEKGAETVMMLGVILRMTVDSDGLEGVSLEVMMVDEDLIDHSCLVVWQ